MDMNLQGKVAIVTGAGRGLGREYAVALVEAGASVVINDVDPELARETAAELSSDGRHAVPLAGAVGEDGVAESLVATAAEAFGRLDALVANAGVLRDAVLWKTTDDDFDTVVRVHLRGTFQCVRAAAREMRRQGNGGRIVCVGSPTGQRGMFGQGNYSAAKAGIVGMVRTWAMELARDEVTVNAVVPVAATEMTLNVPALRPFAEAAARGEELPPFARRSLGFGTAADAASLVTYLVSNAAAGVTGQAIGIGGDRLVLWSHPEPVVTAYADGGWTADGIAQAWPTTFASAEQRLGEQLPTEVPA
jgi:NAD(P)-dependent dehydrogenase (short-subunit alcohol dehydrogenase family)